MVENNCSLYRLHSWKVRTKALPTGGVFPTANTLQLAACWHKKHPTHPLREAGCWEVEKEGGHSAHTHLLERVGVSGATGDVIAESIYKGERESHISDVVPLLHYFMATTMEVLSPRSNTQNESGM